MSGDGTPSDQPETVMDDAIAGLSARADATDQNITRMSENLSSLDRTVRSLADSLTNAATTQNVAQPASPQAVNGTAITQFQYPNGQAPTTPTFPIQNLNYPTNFGPASLPRHMGAPPGFYPNYYSAAPTYQNPFYTSLNAQTVNAPVNAPNVVAPPQPPQLPQPPTQPAPMAERIQPINHEHEQPEPTGPAPDSNDGTGQRPTDAASEPSEYYSENEQSANPTPPPAWVEMLQRAMLLNGGVDPFVICDEPTTVGTFYIGVREHVESLCSFLNKQPDITKYLGKVAVRSAYSISADHLLAAQFDSFHIHSYVDTKSGFVLVHSSTKWNGFPIIENSLRRSGHVNRVSLGQRRQSVGVQPEDTSGTIVPPEPPTRTDQYPQPFPSEQSALKPPVPHLGGTGFKPNALNAAHVNHQGGITDQHGFKITPTDQLKAETSIETLLNKREIFSGSRMGTIDKRLRTYFVFDRNVVNLLQKKSICAILHIIYDLSHIMFCISYKISLYMLHIIYHAL